MRLVEVYESVDGQLFRSRNDAEKHDLDCIGEEFDGLMLLAVQATNGNVTRHDQFKMCMALIDSKNRQAVTDAVRKLNGYLQVPTPEEDE